MTRYPGYVSRRPLISTGWRFCVARDEYTFADLFNEEDCHGLVFRAGPGWTDTFESVLATLGKYPWDMRWGTASSSGFAMADLGGRARQICA